MDYDLLQLPTVAECSCGTRQGNRTGPSVGTEVDWGMPTSLLHRPWAPPPSLGLAAAGHLTPLFREPFEEWGWQEAVCAPSLESPAVLRGPYCNVLLTR